MLRGSISGIKKVKVLPSIESEIQEQAARFNLKDFQRTPLRAEVEPTSTAGLPLPEPGDVLSSWVCYILRSGGCGGVSGGKKHGGTPKPQPVPGQRDSQTGEAIAGWGGVQPGHTLVWTPQKGS